MVHDEGFANNDPILDAEWMLVYRGRPGVRFVEARPGCPYADAHIPGAFENSLYALNPPDSSPAASDASSTTPRPGTRARRPHLPVAVPEDE